MPKNTFFNLHKDKADRIIEVSVEEFAKYSYENASINRIVEEAEIAKGSFYQYFEDKKDLYKYIIEESKDKKLSYIKAFTENSHYTDFFSSLKELYLAELKFAIELPKLSLINLSFAKNCDTELKKEILGETYKEDEIFKKLILIGIDNKDIDDSIDIKLNTFLLASLNISILEYFSQEAKFDYKETTKYIENIVELIKDGIKTKKRVSRSVEDRFY